MLTERPTSSGASRGGSWSSRPDTRSAVAANLLLHEEALTTLLSSGDLPEALEFINTQLIPDGVRKDFDRGRKIEAKYRGKGTPVSVRRDGEGVIILVRNIDVRELNKKNAEPSIGTVESSLREHIQKNRTGDLSFKGRLRVSITPNEVEATLERATREGQWREISESPRLRTPEAIAHIAGSIDFAKAESILEENAPRRSQQPPSENPPIKTSDSSRVLPSIYAERVKATQEVLAMYRDRYGLYNLSNASNPEARKAQDEYDLARTQYQDALNRLQQKAGSASSQPPDRARKPWKGKRGRGRGTSTYSEKHGYRR